MPALSRRGHHRDGMLQRIRRIRITRASGLIGIEVAEQEALVRGHVVVAAEAGAAGEGPRPRTRRIDARRAARDRRTADLVAVAQRRRGQRSQKERSRTQSQQKRVLHHTLLSRTATQGSTVSIRRARADRGGRGALWKSLLQ